jgi:hypothetical protein
MNTISTNDFQYTVGRPLFRLPRAWRMGFWGFLFAVLAALAYTGMLVYGIQGEQASLSRLTTAVTRQRDENELDRKQIQKLELNSQQQLVWYPLFATKFSMATMLSRTLEVIPTSISLEDFVWNLNGIWEDSTAQFTAATLSRTKEEAADMLLSFRKDFTQSSKIQINDNKSTTLRQKPININGVDTRLLITSEQWSLTAPKLTLAEVTENMRRLEVRDGKAK